MSALRARRRPGAHPLPVPVLGRHEPRWCRRVDASVATVSGRVALPRAPRVATVVTRASSSSGAPGGKDLYELLDVSTTATPKEIKSAYKKAALKYHPDVNKAPDAAERFNEVKSAYQTLSDPDARRRYDLLRAGGGARARPSDPGKPRDRRETEPDPTTGAGRASARSQEEPFYGFSDFWRDVEKEFEAFEKSRPDPGKPRTLWEELGTLGRSLWIFSRNPPLTRRRPPRIRSRGRPPPNERGIRRRRARKRTETGVEVVHVLVDDDEQELLDEVRIGAGAGRAPPKRESVDEMLEKIEAGHGAQVGGDASRREFGI